jgi:hypothetical protein
MSQHQASRLIEYNQSDQSLLKVFDLSITIFNGIGGSAAAVYQLPSTKDPERKFSPCSSLGPIEEAGLHYLGYMLTEDRNRLEYRGDGQKPAHGEMGDRY